MKTKKFNKRLVLNKKTVADLNCEEMNNALGGVVNTVDICFTEDGPRCQETVWPVICFTVVLSDCVPQC